VSQAEPVERKQPTCGHCGGATFVEGEIAPWNLTFKPHGARKLAVGDAVQARKCNTCGHLELFAQIKP
jgi:ribosomal protein S27AE